MNGALVNLIQLGLAVIMAAIGWIVVHRLQERREKLNSKRELVTGCLIEVYRALHDVSNIPQPDKEQAERAQRAIADIQLFGNDDQIRLAKKYADDLSDNGRAETSSILLELRDSLRTELNLPKVSISPFFFKWFVEDKPQFPITD